MGKKTRKTRWRTLDVPFGDVKNNSPTTNTNNNNDNNAEINKKEDNNNKFRTYERSSSTTTSTLANKTSTNTKPIDEDDEYTKITTPRQDVLFKRRYYNRRAEAAMNKLQNEELKEMTYENDVNAPMLEGEDPSQAYVCAAPPNAYIDPSAVYFMNGGSYEIYDPYAGNLTVVVAPPSGHYAPGGGAAQPLLAAVPCQPVPLQQVQWFNPTPAQGEWYPNVDPVNGYPIESQNGSGVGSESSGITENPSEVMDESMMTNNGPIFQQPSYVYPGYVFGAPIYNVNGVNVQYCRAPSPTPSSNSDLLTGKRKKKRKRRRRTGEADDESISSTEDQYNQTVIYETHLEEIADNIQIITNNNNTEENLQIEGNKEEINLEKEEEEEDEDEEEEEEENKQETKINNKEATNTIKSKSSGLNVNCKPYVCKQDRYKQENNDKHDLSSETGCSSNNSDSGISSPNSDTSHLKEDLCQSKIHFKSGGKKEQQQQVNDKNTGENNKRQQQKGTSTNTVGSSNGATSAPGHKKQRTKKTKENNVHENHHHEYQEIQEESGLQHALSNLSQNKNSSNNNKTRPKNKIKGKDKIEIDVEKKKSKKVIENGIDKVEDDKVEIVVKVTNTKKLNNQTKKHDKKVTDNDNNQKLKNNKIQTSHKEGKKSKKGKEQHENDKTNEKLTEIIENPNHVKETLSNVIEEKFDYLEKKMEETTYVYVDEKPLLAKLVDIDRLPELSKDENKTEDFTQFSSCREDIQSKTSEEEDGTEQPKAPPRRKKLSIKSIENVAKDIVEDVVAKAEEEALHRGKDIKAHLPITTAVSEWLTKQGGLVVPSDDSTDGSDFSESEESSSTRSISHDLKKEKKKKNQADKTCVIS